MALTIAIQMDHIRSIDIKGDSTFRLCLEAQARGHQLLHYTPDHLSMHDGTVLANAEPLTVADQVGNHFSLGQPVPTDLRDCDVVLLRQDPPFDLAYITTTHLLERVHPHTLVVNNPAAVRNAPEKILVTDFPELMPETLITRDPVLVREFRERFGDIIVKPLFGNGGNGVFRIMPGDENLQSLIELFRGSFREPFIVQRYMAEVRKGDKRIILVDGEPLGAINRVPAEGEARSNMHVGGRAEHSEINDEDRAICEKIGPVLRERDLIFVGIDVIGGKLTEINVTSPTGLREIERFGGINLAARIWDAIESRCG